MLGKTLLFWFISSLFLATVVQDGPLVRPHPFFWRFILGFTIIQTLLIIGCTMLDREVIRSYLVMLTPNSAGDHQPERDYSMSCAIYDSNHPEDPFHNVKCVVFDIFVPAHFFGWLFKAIIFRDSLLCWFSSISFEIVERSLKHWFPNFNECWWDSFILDVILCNGLGIYVGMKIVNKLVIYPWERRLLCEVRSTNEKLARMFSQITPRHYSKFEWEPLRNPKRYFIFWLLVITINLVDFNTFGIKMVLKISTTSIILIIHLIMQIVIACPAVFEIYLYAIDLKNTIGAYAATFILYIIAELVLIFKCSDGYFTEPFPTSVIVFDSILISTISIFPIIWFGIMKKGKDKND